MEPTETRNPQPAGNRLRAQGNTSRAILSPVDAILDRLDRVKSTGPGTWLASCPTANHRHGDRSRGLSVREGDDGRVLVHCHAGCPVHEVVDALGMELADLFPARQIEYPNHAPKGGIIGRGRIKRIPWADLFEALELDLRACSMAFCDLASGKPFSPTDAASIARMAGHLADEIGEVLHGR